MRVELNHGKGQQPLYVQLADALETFIAREQLRPGDLLPSETVLAGENQLSRATVIKAFDSLVERGLVTRRRGRGTFVSAKPMQRQLPEFTSFSEHVHGLGRTPGSSLVSFAAFGPDDAARPASPFDAEGEDGALVRVERLRTVAGEPVGIHRTLVPGTIAERVGLTEQTAAHPDFSFYDALRRADVYLASGEESLRAINASRVDARLLGVDEGTALIEVVRLSRDPHGQLIEVAQARYLGTQYVYHIAFAPTQVEGNPDETFRSSTRTGGGLASARRVHEH